MSTITTQNYNFTLFTRPVWRQNLDSTWDGINSSYINNFKASGCFLCSLTMLTACMEGSFTLKPSTLVSRGVTTSTSPAIVDYSKASSQFTLSEKESNILYYIVKTLIEDRKPVFIQVQGHAVVAYGFNGDVTLEDGAPQYSLVSKSSIKIYDPQMGRYDNNVPGLISQYGDITKIRIPE